jgi:hypothetical protein
MSTIFHITSGDICGGSLAKAGLPGEVFVWHDILYEGPRNPGWPTDATLEARARFLVQATGGGLKQAFVLQTLRDQYAKLASAGAYDRVVLWFDACLFDMAMLAHILACMQADAISKTELLVVDAFPGIEPYDGLGQLSPAQMAAVYPQRRPVTRAQLECAVVADRAFATQDKQSFVEIASKRTCALFWMVAAAKRWLEEQPDPVTGLGRLEQRALEAIRAGNSAPADIFKAVASCETHPQFWGDTTLWARINGLADRGLVGIEGPAPRLPQWEGQGDLRKFRINKTV